MEMLSHSMQSVYIDEYWALKEYLRRVKEKYWDEEQDWGYKHVIELEKEISCEFSAGAEEEENVYKYDDDNVDLDQIFEVESYSDTSSDSDK